jgi:hypothetical protein
LTSSEDDNEINGMRVSDGGTAIEVPVGTTAIEARPWTFLSRALTCLLLL